MERPSVGDGRCTGSVCQGLVSLITIHRRTELKTRHLFLCILAWVSCLFLLACTGAHSQPPASTEKLKNIRKLIVLLGGLDVQKRSLQDELASLREKVPRLRAEDGEALAKEVDEKEIQPLIDNLVPVYDKYLTDEEVSELLKFYESPTGKRVAQALPQMREESRRITLEWRQSLVKKLMDKQGGLIPAVTTGDTATVKQLLSSGADVNERNSRGTTPLMAAAYKGNMDLAKLLVEKGADVNARSNKGSTPLMAAVQYGNKEPVKFLLDNGADANAKEEKGLNAYQLAAMKDQRELVALLRDKTTDKKSVRISFVITSSAKDKDCAPIMSLASDSSKKITCLKLGQEVLPIPDVSKSNGWTLIQYPKLGWVPSESIKEKLVSGEEQRKILDKPQETVASKRRTEAHRPSAESPEKETGGTEAVTEPTDQPRIWWRRY